MAKYLILCPHPDDEMHINFTLLREHPNEIHIAVFTTGKAGTNELDQECIGSKLVALRYQETILAMSEMGVNPEQLTFLGYEDGRENEEQTKLLKSDRIKRFVSSIECLCSRLKPEEVYAPAPFEVHIDHKHIGIALLKSNINARKIFSCYPKTIEAPPPDFTVQLNEEFFKERLCLLNKFYKSQQFLTEKLSSPEFQTDRYWYADSVEQMVPVDDLYTVRDESYDNLNFRYLFDNACSKRGRVSKVLKEKYSHVDPWKYISSLYEKRRFMFLSEFISEHFDEDTYIVDMGCGNGVLCHQLYEKGYPNIEGYDCMEKAINEAKTRWPNLNFYVGDFKRSLLTLKRGKAEVDLFMFNDCLYYIHITEFTQIITHVRRSFPQAKILISGGTHFDMKEYFSAMLSEYMVEDVKSLSRTYTPDLITVLFYPKSETCLSVQTSKHIAPPVLAFLTIARKDAVLHNLPRIGDVEYMLSVMRRLGFFLERKANGIIELRKSDYSLEDWTCFEWQIRQNILFLPECIRHKRIVFPIPHGDAIGERTIDEYLRILSLFGCHSKIIDECKIEVLVNDLSFPVDIYLEIDSTGVSIMTIIMVIILNKGYVDKDIRTVRIRNVSDDLELEWFVNFLNQNNTIQPLPIVYDRDVGDIRINPHLVKIKDVVSFHIPYDRAVLFDMIIFIGCEIIKKHCDREFYLDIPLEQMKKILGVPVIDMLEKFGFRFTANIYRVRIDVDEYNVDDEYNLEASKYPELSTDMLPILITFLTILGNNVSANDNYFEWRVPLLYNELEKMQAGKTKEWISSNIRQTVCGLLCLCFTDKVLSVVDTNGSIFRGYEKDFICKIETITGKKIKMTNIGTQIKFELWN